WVAEMLRRSGGTDGRWSWLSTEPSRRRLWLEQALASAWAGRLESRRSRPILAQVRAGGPAWFSDNPGPRACRRGTRIEDRAGSRKFALCVPPGAPWGRRAAPPANPEREPTE